MIKSILENVNIKGWAFDVDLLVTLFREGYSIKEYPINWYHDDNSKVKLISDGWRMLISIFKIRRSAKKVQYKKLLFLQHHYMNQGTFIRAINLATNIANKDLQIMVTGINNSMKFTTEYEYLDENPYVTIIKLPRFFAKNSPLDILLRLPFAIWETLKQDYSLLYAFALGMPTNSIPTLFFKLFRRKSIIVDWDDLWFNGYGKYTGKAGNYIFYIFERFSLKLIRPKHATAVSLFLKDKFISHGMNSSDVTIIGNGVKQEVSFSKKNKAELKKQYHISSQTKVLVSVGNTYGKSFENLIEAFKLSSKQDDSLKLFLLGNFMKSGKLGKYLERVIKSNRELFLSRVTILGHIPLKNYIDYLTLSDIAILPMEDTDIDRARFPIRLGDYIKYNLPIVSNATGVVEEILKKYEYGLITDVKNIREFERNILKCAANTELYTSEEKVKRILDDELSWTVQSNKLISIINTLLRN